MDGVHPYESKSNDELFELAFGDDSEADEDYEAESPWAAMRVLRQRDTPHIFERAKTCCTSPVPRHRERGVQILAQLVWKNDGNPRFAEVLEFAIVGTQDTDLSVARAGAWALARLDGERSKNALMLMKDHSDAEIRYEVAVGLVGAFAAGSVPVLMELMEDSDDKVRDWATFALGAMGEPDSPEIREALRKRLSDSYDDARHEAVWGLAKRKDRQGVEILLARLEADTWLSGDEETACYILGLRGDPPIEELCAGLRALLPS